MDIIQRAYNEQNLYVLTLDSGPRYGELMSTKPIRSLEDVKGMKIRTFGAFAEMYEGLGAGIVSVPGGEMYTALATGVIDAATWGSPGGFYSYDIQEVTKYYIGPPLTVISAVGIIINLDT
ncbi:unnamed protein product [marine sediment metagenome]|uniref:Uncharacterized protein n=1 Tax=marine sediment metagenome TaxID=412755 RepID=X1RN25_9ZZZZ